MEKEKTIGERIKYLRYKRNLSQKQLANIAGVPETSISHFEIGDREPAIGTLQKLAKALNTSADYLLSMTFSEDSIQRRAEYEALVQSNIEKLQFTRDYWLKLYAGMAMAGMSAIPQMVTPDNETPTYNELADECYNRALYLTDKMFKDKS